MITDNNTLYEREMATRGAKIGANKALYGRELAARDKTVKKLRQTKKRLLARISELDADKVEENQPISTGPLGATSESDQPSFSCLAVVSFAS
ncbi:MAG: hypothetical protein Q9193_007047 [Seirophora villosa]